MNQQDANYFQSWNVAIWNKLVAMQATQQAIQLTLSQILKEENQMSVDLSQLQAAVSAETTADASIITLLNQIAANLQALTAQTGDLAALQTAINGYASTLQSNATSVVAAVNANTNPPPTPAPSP